MTRILAFLSHWQWIGWLGWSIFTLTILASPFAAIFAALVAGLYLEQSLRAKLKQDLEQQIEQVHNREAQLLVAINCASPEERIAIDMAEQAAGARRQ